MSNPQRTGNSLIDRLKAQRDSLPAYTPSVQRASIPAYVQHSSPPPPPAYEYQLGNFSAPSAPSLQLPNTRFYNSSISSPVSSSSSSSSLIDRLKSTRGVPAAPAAVAASQPSGRNAFVFHPASPSPPQLPNTNFYRSVPTRPEGNSLIATLQRQREQNSSVSNQVSSVSSSSSIVTPNQRAAEAAFRRHQAEMDAALRRQQADVDAAFRVDNDSDFKYADEQSSLNQGQRREQVTKSPVIAYGRQDIRPIQQNYSALNNIIQQNIADTKDTQTTNSSFSLFDKTSRDSVESVAASAASAAPASITVYRKPRVMSSKAAIRVDPFVAASGVGSGSYAAERAKFNSRLSLMSQSKGNSDTNQNQRESLYQAAKQINDELQSTTSEERKAELVSLLTRFFADDETRRLFPTLS